MGIKEFLQNRLQRPAEPDREAISDTNMYGNQAYAGASPEGTYVHFEVNGYAVGIETRGNADDIRSLGIQAAAGVSTDAHEAHFVIEPEE